MKRTKEIRFRLTTEEKERLIIAAKRAGYTQSGYTRAAIEMAISTPFGVISKVETNYVPCAETWFFKIK